MKLIKCIADVAMPCCCCDYSKLDHNHFSVERARQYAAELQRTRAAFGGWTTSYAAKSPQRPSTPSVQNGLAFAKQARAVMKKLIDSASAGVVVTMVVR
jgi:hypothetical protein